MPDQPLFDQLIKKAWEDEAFKKELLANPRAAVSKELGVEIPEGVEVVAMEDTPRKLHVVIPMSPVARAQRELSSEELEQVAGGISWGCCSRSGGP